MLKIILNGVELTGEFNQCIECRFCSVLHTAGFISETYYICEQWSVQVDEDDGCTFGMKGEPHNESAYDSIILDNEEQYEVS